MPALMPSGGAEETDTKSSDIPKENFRMITAFLLAVLVHAVLFCMVMFQISWQMPADPTFPVLDLHPFVCEMVPSVQPAAGTAPEMTGGASIPVRIVPDEDHLGVGAREKAAFLRVLRKGIGVAWRRVVPSDTGRGVVLLTINGRGRLEHAKILQMQGRNRFGQFLDAFLITLGKRTFPVLKGKGVVRVECEFRVGE